jgi:hypothetical protein
MSRAMQLDGAVTPPGVFSPARTFSLVRDDGGLYLIYTGRAMGPAPRASVAGAIAGAVLNKIADKRAAEIAEVEATLRDSSAAAMKDTPHSRYVPRASIQEIAVHPGSYVRVVVRADKKLKLHLWQDEATVRQFFEPLRP